MLNKDFEPGERNWIVPEEGALGCQIILVGQRCKFCRVSHKGFFERHGEKDCLIRGAEMAGPVDECRLW